MRLIDADSLKEAMQEHTDYKGYLVCDPEEIIDLAPTVERPNGEWEHWGSPFVDDCIVNSIMCSLCKARFVEMGEVYNFCPNCGADMREGDPDDRA